MSEYKDLLLDPRWQKRRLEILERDAWSCQACGSKKRTLHIHHAVAYDGRKPWEYRDAELQTLCWYCHGRLNGTRPGSVSVAIDEWGYDGLCPWCGSDKLRDKGARGDGCLECGRRIEFHLRAEVEGKTENELRSQLAKLA